MARKPTQKPENAADQASAILPADATQATSTGAADAATGTDAQSPNPADSLEGGDTGQAEGSDAATEVASTAEGADAPSANDTGPSSPTLDAATLAQALATLDPAVLSAALETLAAGKLETSPVSVGVDLGREIAGEDVEVRFATVVSPIDHDGFTFVADDPIALSEAAFNQLRATGALLEATWDELVTI